ncbi:hypothetical protein IQ07DRAFT_642589 [Pyrenochaeta sp. DS3sAY3a]|nr:hypothetical protein IQ07DRAFT_642589 [Pyrenochaeta sp. DS3sAY3a]
MTDQYKPTEHDGLKQDGTPDKRFAQGKVDPHEAGKSGGKTSGSGTGSGSGGSGSGEFAHGKVDPVEAGRKGGNTS